MWPALYVLGGILLLFVCYSLGRYHGIQYHAHAIELLLWRPFQRDRVVLLLDDSSELSMDIRTESEWDLDWSVPPGRRAVGIRLKNVTAGLLPFISIDAGFMPRREERTKLQYNISMEYRKGSGASIKDLELRWDEVPGDTSHISISVDFVSVVPRIREMVDLTPAYGGRPIQRSKPYFMFYGISKFSRGLRVLFPSHSDHWDRLVERKRDNPDIRVGIPAIDDPPLVA